MKKTKITLCVLIAVLIAILSTLVVVAETEVTPYSLGDVDGDGRITAADARLTLRFSARLIDLTEQQKKAADINGDGKITAANARRVLRWSARLESPPTEEPENKAAFIKEAIEQAEKAFGNNLDYEAALKIIKQAQQKYPTDPDLKAKEDYYMLFVPVSIFDLNPFTTGRFILDVWYNQKDTMGNIYEKSFRAYMGALDGGQSSTYDIGKKFNVLKGKVSIFEGTGSSPDTGYIKVYGDGKLIYSKTDFIGATKPFDISIDITGVTDLKIEMSADGNMGWSGLSILFSDVTLQRTVK